MMIVKILAGLLAAVAVAGVSIRLLYPLPALEPRPVSQAFTDTADTPLGRGAQWQNRAHPGLSGLHLLNDGRTAFAARVLLARAATRSLDVQYYIWHGDLSGSLMLEEMHRAADRGVRVRMLLDDNGITGLDATLAALDAHPNVEIRLFNPFTVRWPKQIGYLADFARLNRRMHNKSLTADNQATIIGGRNVGDEYFGARDEGLFADLDVLAVGPVVADVSSDFDRYWRSGSAYPAARILPPVLPERMAELAAAAATAERDPQARDYLEAVRSLPIIRQVQDGSLRFEWARVKMVSDNPAKGLGNAPEDGTLWAKLTAAIGVPHRAVDLVSGYFVPTAAGTAAFADLARKGLAITILTNAYEATDVGIVHAGYAQYRKALLRAGVTLYELRSPAGGSITPPARRLIGTGSGSKTGSGRVLRSSGSTLHAKTFAVDGRRLFVGSFNFDPRSMHLNTELGFLIDSPPLAASLDRAFAQGVPQRAYQVVLTPTGDLAWIERTGERTITHHTEPGTSRVSRATIWLLSKLPIEWML
ncbi:phospholipase D family protein [Sphingomonas solaris]|nr:phospholipase D family protein [Sphingomonas solaris]